jgi:hypothetical protein
MGKCLITKLKEVVDNENLVTMDTLKMTVKGVASLTPSANAITVVMYYGNSSKFRVTGEGALARSAADIQTSTDKVLSVNNTMAYVKNVDCNLYVTNKNKIEKFYISPSNVDSIIHIDVSEFKYLSSPLFSDIRVNGNSVSGDIIAFKVCTRLTKLDIVKTACNGDIAAALGNLKSLTSVNVTNSSYITGSIEGLASALVANGKTSGSLSVIGNGTITYNGTAVPNGTAKTITFDQSVPNGYTVS